MKKQTPRILRGGGFHSTHSSLMLALFELRQLGVFRFLHSLGECFILTDSGMVS